jgi:hypothetical protein
MVRNLQQRCGALRSSRQCMNAKITSGFRGLYPWALSVWLGCGSSLDTSLDNMRCSAQGHCVAGWVCNEDQICVREADRSRTARKHPSPAEDAGDAEEDAAAPSSTLVPAAEAASKEPPAREAPRIVQPTAAGAPASPEAPPAEPAAPRTMQPTAAGASGAPAPNLCADDALCAGQCVSLQTDPQHCGTCNTRCPAAAGGSAVCTAGHCGVQCPNGRAACGNACVDLTSDPAHCGACSRACPATSGIVACERGECSLSCRGGSTLCDDACVDTSVDASHCGKCETACKKDESCVDSHCKKTPAPAPDPKEDDKKEP